MTLLLALCAGGAAAEQERANPLGALMDGIAQVRDIIDQAQSMKEEIMNTEIGPFIMAKWKETYDNPDYRIYIDGRDDPAELPITGKHAFVVLGYELANGEMTDELKARCDAAAHAAKAFPDSALVCSGGATGTNNPEGHTEAGLMKDYLTGTCGIAGERILTDEYAMTTLDNAINTFAILEEQEIGEITIVTSSYHQRRANLLYAVFGKIIRKKTGREISIVGNYSCEIEAAEGFAQADVWMTTIQLEEMIKTMLSGEKTE